MKYASKLLILPISLLFVLLLAAKPAQASALYLYDGDTLKVGDTTQVYVILSTEGEDINAVDTNFSYPTDKLELESIDTGTNFPILAEQTVDNGTINLAQGSIVPVNGGVVVATLNFKV